MLEIVLAGVLAFLAGVVLASLLHRRSREAMRATAENLQVRLAETQAYLRAEKEKTAWTDDAKERFKDAFKVLATSELEAKTNQLKTTAKEELGIVVGPLRDELGKLDRQLREVDAKVPLDAFLKAMEAESEEARRDLMKQHAQAVRNRVRELSQRAYWEQFDSTPEVVVMFVPIEASLSAAFQTDRDLFDFAFQNKVLVASPISLFALLKAIAFGWQQQQVAHNAQEIAAQGKTFYERALTFVGHLSALGKSLDSSVRKYNDAVGSLDGRVLPAARKLREMGVGNADIESPQPIELQTRALSAGGDPETSAEIISLK